MVFKIARLALGALVHLHYGCFVGVMLLLMVSLNLQLFAQIALKQSCGERSERNSNRQLLTTFFRHGVLVLVLFCDDNQLQKRS